MKKLWDIFELKAIEYLKKKWYDLIKTNFKSYFWEIDIICKKEDITVFIEVKYRSNNNFWKAIESISKQKLLKLKKTIDYFCMINKIDFEKIRFDVITIEKIDKTYRLTHYKNLEMEI